MNPILGQSTYGGPVNKAGWKMSNIHQISKPNSIARDIFNRQEWRDKRATALSMNESTKKSAMFSPRGPPRLTRPIDPELYSPTHVRRPEPPKTVSQPKAKSDIHGPLPENTGPYVPPPPPSHDTQIYGGNTEREVIYGHQSEAVRQMAKKHELQRMKNTKKTSFDKMEHDRGMKTNDLLAIPQMKNAGLGIVRNPKGWGIRCDDNIYGGSGPNQYPNFWPKEAQGLGYHDGPKARSSIEKQWRDVEMKCGNLSPRYGINSGLVPPKVSQGARYFRQPGSEQIDRWAITNATDVRKYATENPPVPRSVDWTKRNTNPITGGSHYLTEYATRAVDPARKRPQNGFHNFDDQSRKAWNRNIKEHDRKMKELSYLPPPRRGVTMRKNAAIMPHCPNGIYQWPQARKWGVAGMGYGSVEPGVFNINK